MEVKLQLNEQSKGAFYLYEKDQQIGEMDVSISGNHLIAYHTEVSPEWEGKGLSKQLLTAMVNHARTNHLKVIALCPYVHAQFKRHEQEYADIWEKS